MHAATALIDSDVNEEKFRDTDKAEGTCGGAGQRYWLQREVWGDAAHIVHLPMKKRCEKPKTGPEIPLEIAQLRPRLQQSWSRLEGSTPLVHHIPQPRHYCHSSNVTPDISPLRA